MKRLRTRGRDAGGGASSGSASPASITSTGLLFRWAADFSTLTTTTDGGGRTVVTQINDMVASAHLATTTAPESPVLMTDPQGRKFLRFNNAAWMAFTTATAMDYKAVCLYFVGRVHRLYAGGSSIASMIYLNGYTTHAHMNVAISQTTPFLRMVNSATSSATGRNKMVVGSQLQVLCTRSTTTIAARINGDQITITGAATAGTQGSPGGLVGAASTTPTASTSGGFDLYEIAGYTGIISDADVTANCNTYMTYYNIAAITRSIALEGDSRTFGYAAAVGGITGGNASLIPSGNSLSTTLALLSSNNDVRIVSIAATGNRIDDLVTQRDQANNMVSSTGGYVSGWQNDIHFLVGTNDQAQATASGTPVWTTAINTAARADEAMDRATWGMIPYVNTTTTGLLQRGMRVYVSTEIARTTSADMVAIDQFRTRVSAGAFLTSVDAHVGGTYDGKVIVNQLDDWTDGGNTVFSTLADASDTAYYASDALHLTAEGTRQYALSIRSALGLTAA
jgi:hypothetical protein